MSAQRAPHDTRLPRVADTAALRAAALRAGWGEFLTRIPWEWTVTLTFDDGKIWPVNLYRAEREVTWWGRLLAQLYRRAIGWVCALELGRTRRWHGHFLLVGLDGRSVEPAVGAWKQRNGFAQSRKVTDVPGVALYTSKQAADEGYIILSQALSRYKNHLADEPILQFHPENPTSSTTHPEGRP